MSSLRQVLSFARCGTERDRRNQRQILYWAAAWMGLWLAANLAIDRALLPETPLVAALLAFVPAIFGLGALRAYWRYLHEADELLRKIELDALALAFGFALLSSLTCWILGLMGYLDLDGLLMWITSLMLVVYSLAVVVGQLRYAS